MPAVRKGESRPQRNDTRLGPPDPKLSIQDACAFLGITPTMIRKYEQHRNPGRYLTSESGYREFFFESVAELFDERTLMSEGLSMDEAVSMLLGSSLDDRIAAQAGCEESARRRLKYLQDVLCAVEDRRLLMQRCVALGESCEIVTSPALHYLRYSPDSADAGARRDLMRDWASHIPMSWWAPIIDHEQIEELDCFAYSLGLAIPERFASHVRKDPSLTDRLPARRCLATVIEMPDVDGRVPDERLCVDEHRIFQKGLCFLEARGLHLTGDVLCRLVATNVLSGAGDSNKVDVYYAWYPID